MKNRRTNLLKISAGTAFLILLMFLNIQIGLNDGEKTDVNMFGLKATVYTPTASASGCCFTQYASRRNFLGNCTGMLINVCETSGTCC